MPRALSRDEQAILALVRRADAALPVPELAARLGLDPAAAQAACDYLVDHGTHRFFGEAPSCAPSPLRPAV